MTSIVRRTGQRHGIVGSKTSGRIWGWPLDDPRKCRRVMARPRNKHGFGRPHGNSLTWGRPVSPCCGIRPTVSDRLERPVTAFPHARSLKLEFNLSALCLYHEPSLRLRTRRTPTQRHAACSGKGIGLCWRQRRCWHGTSGGGGGGGRAEEKPRKGGEKGFQRPVEGAWIRAVGRGWKKLKG